MLHPHSVQGGRHAHCTSWHHVVWLVVTSLTIFGDGSPESDAKRLYDDKLKKNDYSKLIRPVGNTTDSLTVRVGLRLTSIIDVVSFALAALANHK